MYMFRSHFHEIYTQLWSKVTLDNKDDKRYVSHNNVDTYANGHYNIIYNVNDYLESFNSDI